MVLELLPGTPGLQGDDGNVITLGLPGGERVAGGDRAPAGTPTGLQCSSGFMCQVRGTASVARKQERRRGQIRRVPTRGGGARFNAETSNVLPSFFLSLNCRSGQ